MIAILEPEAAQCATLAHEHTALDALGVAIRHGHEVHPWPGIAQALWFSIASMRGEQSPSLSLGSLIAYELSNSAMLLEEGIAMRHCIASYAPLCAEGNNFVFSLQTTAGIRRSTLHVTKNAAQHFRVEEHRSFANHSPDQTSSVAAQMLITHLSHIK